MNDYAPTADLRSAARARNRTTANLKKYYSYKTLKPNQRLQPHIVIPCYLHSSPDCQKCGWGRALPPLPAARAALPTRALTKREFYDEAQAWPKPPRRHHAYPKQDSKWGCRVNAWARRSGAAKEVGRELREREEFHEAERVVEDELEHMITCGYCGGVNDPGWWEGERVEWAGEDLVVGAPWADEEEGVEDEEGEREGAVEVVAGVEEDEDWDVVSCVSETGSWEEVEEEDWV